MAARRRSWSKAAPGYIPELDPIEANSPPTGEGWVHEVKWDGFRAQAHLRQGRVTTYSRSGLNWTNEFDTVSEAVAKLEAKSAVIDGEVVVIGPGGKPDFQALRRNLNKHSAALQYYAFDLLELNGKDLRARPLLERKVALEKLLAHGPDRLRYVEHFETDPRQVIEAACNLGLEGIVSKKADSLYKPGRQASWVKSKCRLTDNFPIIAFVEKLGAKPGASPPSTLVAAKAESFSTAARSKAATRWKRHRRSVRRSIPLSARIRRWMRRSTSPRQRGSSRSSRRKSTIAPKPTPAWSGTVHSRGCATT